MARSASYRCKSADRVHSVLQILLPPTRPNAPTKRNTLPCIVEAFITYSLEGQAGTAEGSAGASDLAGQAADRIIVGRIRQDVRHK